MTKEEPHPWVILGGLRDSYNPPYPVHTVQEFPGMLELWRTSRRGHWPEVGAGRHFLCHWSAGKVAFMTQGMETNDPVDGFMLYGTSPLNAELTQREMLTLAALLCARLGQSVVELHVLAQVILVTRDEKHEPT